MNKEQEENINIKLSALLVTLIMLAMFNVLVTVQMREQTMKQIDDRTNTIIKTIHNSTYTVPGTYCGQ